MMMMMMMNMVDLMWTSHTYWLLKVQYPFVCTDRGSGPSRFVFSWKTSEKMQRMTVAGEVCRPSFHRDVKWRLQYSRVVPGEKRPQAAISPESPLPLWPFHLPSSLSATWWRGSPPAAVSGDFLPITCCNNMMHEGAPNLTRHPAHKTWDVNVGWIFELLGTALVFQDVS